MSVYSKFDVIASNRSGNLLIWVFLVDFQDRDSWVKPGRRKTQNMIF